MRHPILLTAGFIICGTSFAQSDSSQVSFDIDVKALQQEPPETPKDAERSGRCKLKFDINEIGQTQNIKVIFCTEKIFASNAIEAVSEWKYSPAKLNGNAIYRAGRTVITVFPISGFWGDLRPEATDNFYYPAVPKNPSAPTSIAHVDSSIVSEAPTLSNDSVAPSSVAHRSHEVGSEISNSSTISSPIEVDSFHAGLDIRVTSKVPQVGLDAACKAAFGHINIVAAGGTANDVKPVCTTLTRKSFTTDLEDQMYDILGTANDKLIYAEYYAKSDQYSNYGWDRYQKIMAPLTSQLPTKDIPPWVVSAEIGSELDHEKLSQLSLRFELISVSFLTSNSNTKALQHVSNWVTGGKQRYVNYTRYGAYVNLEYRMTAKHNNQTLLDTTFTQSERVVALDKCIDPEGGGRHTSCTEDSSRYHKWTKTDPEPHKLATAILTQKSVIFDKLTPSFHQRGEQRFREGYRSRDKYHAITTLPENSQSKAKAILPNLETYKQSFRDISGGRAQFAIKSVGLFKAAEPRLRETSGARGRNLSAGADAAQAQCIAEIQRRDAREKKEAKKTLGFLGSALGLPSEAVTIGTMVSGAVVDMVELTFDQQEEVNRCVSAKGY